jgi:hypothetical protein
MNAASSIAALLQEEGRAQITVSREPGKPLTLICALAMASWR